MKIYTKQGDKGKTSVYTNDVLKLDKDDLILECYGTLDELNSYLGLVSAQVSSENLLSSSADKIKSDLQSCQHNIFNIGFAISDQDKLSQNEIDLLEKSIDHMQKAMPAQTSFILPGGSVIASQLHIARTVARRAERRLVSLAKTHQVNPLALSFINRLSDYLFVLARFSNHQLQVEDIKV